MSTLHLLSQKLNIYLGIPLFISGVTGGCLSIIIFLSLKTFRNSSCAFYLIVMSFTNIGQLLTALLSRIILYVINTDWTTNLESYCKLRFYLIAICSSMSSTCLCLATIDQFLATSSKVQWQRCSNIKLSRYLCSIFFLIWILSHIPIIVSPNRIMSFKTDEISCIVTNLVYVSYMYYDYAITLVGLLTISATIFFGLLAYQNTQQIPYRTVPLVRRELDKQLTVMVLIQVIFNCFTAVPSIILHIYVHIIGISNDAIIELISTISICLYYSYFACPFYIYICASKRFRQQLVYVICQKKNINRVQPEVNQLST